MGGALASRAFRRFLSAQAISLMGTWMQAAAQAWLVLELTGSATRLGVVSAVQSLPVLFLSLAAGAVADRVRRRRLMMLTQITMTVGAVVLGVLTVTGWVRYWHVVVLAALYGVANTFDMPVRHALIGDMVEREFLAQAVGINSSIFNVARLVGPAAAGLVVAEYGSGPAFLLNALSFVPVIAVLAGIRVRSDLRPVAGGEGGLLQAGRLWQPIAEGLRYVQRVEPIRRSLALLGIVSLFTMNFNVLVPVYAQRVLHREASGYGFLMAAMGVGALVGALGLAATRRGEPPPWRRAAGVFALAAGSLGLGAAAHFGAAAVLLAACGFGMVSLSAATNSLVQLSSHEDFRGRALSVFTLVLVGVAPLGSLLSGGVADHWGTRASFVLGGVVALAAGLWFRPWEIHAATAGVAPEPTPAAGPGQERGDGALKSAPETDAQRAAAAAGGWRKLRRPAR